MVLLVLVLVRVVVKEVLVLQVVVVLVKEVAVLTEEELVWSADYQPL